MTTATDEKRSAILDAWLERNEARCLWSKNVQHVGTMQCYSIKGKVFMVLTFKNDGWELFVPPSDKNDIASTLDAAAEMLGCQGCRDLV